MNRRAFLAGALALHLWSPRLRAAARGLLPFVDENDRAVGRLEQDGLAGRYAFDHRWLDITRLITPTNQFFIRTRFPKGAPAPEPWRVATPEGALDPMAIAARARPMGTHLLECSGNNRDRHFGLISVTRFAGLPVYELVLHPPAGQLVLIAGFDAHMPGPDWSSSGASWIFRPEELAHAFFATAMNGTPLTADHGAPLRLVVPGWYGCCCIKWVERIDFVAGDAPATPQMREFASRIHQVGVPTLARNYAPAVIDPAAMAVRVETVGADTFRVVGVQWGGAVERLAIRFGDGPFVPVEELHRGSASAWSIWTHRWRPTRSGRTAISLRVEDPGRRTRRLDSGYYTRWVEVPAN